MNLEPYLPVHGYSEAGVGNTPFVTLGPVVVTPSRARARARVPVNPTVLIETLTGVYVETSWMRDGTGSSDYAVTDADYFDDRVGENQTSLSVIASGEDIPAGSYALRAVQYGPVGTPGNVYDMVGKINCWDPTYDGRTNTPRDVAHRIYLKTRDTSSGRDHFYGPHPTAWSNLWALGKTALEYTFRLSLYTPNTSNPTSARRWDLQYDLDLDTWYRIEILLKYNSETEFRIWPRIYALGDTLLYDADDFRDSTATNYLGTYQATNWLAFDDSALESTLGRNAYGALNCVTTGNDGPLAATYTGLPWFVSNCKVIEASALASTSAVWVGPDEDVPMAVLFESDWSTATGNSDNALRDGGKWTGYACNDLDILTVVADDSFYDVPGNNNALRCQTRRANPGDPGSIGCKILRLVDGWTAGQDHYCRIWFRCDDYEAGLRPHPYEYDSNGSDSFDGELFYLMPDMSFSQGTGWEWIICLKPEWDSSPTGWEPFYTWVYGESASSHTKLSNETWYRVEHHVEIVDDDYYSSYHGHGGVCKFRIYPRLYNRAGTLLGDYENIFNGGFGDYSPYGNNWNLKNYYDEGYVFQVEGQDSGATPGIDLLTYIGLGQNGQAAANDTHRYYYWADFKVATNWVGA